MLASWAIAAAAHASYGQMRLDGIGFVLAFLLTIAYGVIVDVALIARIFRYRAALVTGVVIALVAILFLLGQVASPSERAGFFAGVPGGAPLVVFSVTSAVFLPFIVIAPAAQYLALRQGVRSPRWIAAWMGLQLALLPGFLVLAVTEERFWKQDYAAGQTVGRAARAGGLGAILERAEQQPERIWGTGWTYRWHREPASGAVARRSGWIGGLARGVDASAPIAANEPLSVSDRTVLQALVERHFTGNAIPNIQTKLIWDALEPGDFARQLAPHGLNEQGVVSEELIPLLLDRLEEYGEVRLCPGGLMMDADRAVLSQLVLAKVGAYDEARERELKAGIEAEKLEREMSEAPAPYRLIWAAANALENAFGGQAVGVPDWSSYPQRVERLCRGPE
ncbi:MAG TPA: hypothetical protein VM074_01720 [Solimonas sp.]|nr:hypothetical protein [Solimonas sp.]